MTEIERDRRRVVLWAGEPDDGDRSYRGAALTADEARAFAGEIVMAADLAQFGEGAPETDERFAASWPYEFVKGYVEDAVGCVEAHLEDDEEHDDSSFDEGVLDEIAVTVGQALTKDIYRYLTWRYKDRL